jgi:predicted cupin superfamily sugar epimerase
MFVEIGGKIMSNVTVDELIEMYDLQPHPEGGYFKETYRAAETMNTNNGDIFSHP